MVLVKGERRRRIIEVGAGNEYEERDHTTSGSGEEDFNRFLPYMGLAAILVM